MFSYVSHRLPEIADEIYKIDAAMCAGFGWKMGPFEIWDTLGLEKGISLMESENTKIPKWIIEMSHKNFYTLDKGVKQYYNIKKDSFSNIPTLNKFTILNNIRSTQLIWENEGVSILDIGDEVLNIEFHTKMR